MLNEFVNGLVLIFGCIDKEIVVFFSKDSCNSFFGIYINTSFHNFFFYYSFYYIFVSFLSFLLIKERLLNISILVSRGV